jgi:hypothetical protein
MQILQVEVEWQEVIQRVFLIFGMIEWQSMFWRCIRDQSRLECLQGISMKFIKNKNAITDEVPTQK